MSLRLAGFGLFILFLLTAMAALWPASALAPWVENASKNRWQLVAAEGSLWHGKGIMLAHDSAGRNIVQNIRWQMQWGELLHGRIGVEAFFEKGDALITAAPEGFSIERLDTEMPAAVLVALLPGALGRYSWTGTLQARSSAFHCTWKGGVCSGEIDIAWNDAAVAEVPGDNFGDYRVRMVGEGRALRFDLSTLRGRLQINGSGEIAAKGLRFSGEAGASGANAASLDALLRTLGRPAATPGKYMINYREINSNQARN